MLKVEGCALILLAAGRSRRFGVSDKLAADAEKLAGDGAAR